MNIPKEYTLLRREEIPEIGVVAYIVHHNKTGARLLLMETGDDNKVFNIIFRTPPENDCGIPHILEHSVLCGSEKYPLKDPFVELAKGSLNTFLNAITFPEKTMYPVASCNDADFKNLMSVYMDAVLRPNIYREEKIFRQEGWHYELEDERGPLTVNGVVYNEMKGAYSDPDTVLEDAQKAALFPDTPYRYESGGRPDSIPALSYEAFLDFHRRYYHPSNSWIYLYGNMDFNERLTWLDKEYLSGYERKEVDSRILLEKPFDGMKVTEKPFGISEGEEEDSCIFSLAKVVGGLFDPVDYLAFEVLSYALLNAPGAPLREAILKEGLGNDIYGGYDASLLQPVFSINARGAKKERFNDFLKTVSRVLSDVAEKGISEKTILAGINNIEFSLREADYGRYPKGLVYGLQAADTWLFDEDKALIHLKYNETFEKLKEYAKTDYYAGLLKKALCDNESGAAILLYPDKNLLKADEEKEKARLSALLQGMTKAEKEKIIRDAGALNTYQETPDSPETLKTIPLLSVGDIKKEIEPLINEEREISGIPAVFHNIVTSGILYLDIRFSLSAVSLEDMPYVSLLKALYTQMNTEHFSYQELNDEISLCLGGLSADMSTYERMDEKDSLKADFCVRAKAVRANAKELSRLISEVVFGTDFSDTGRIREIIGEMRIQIENNMVSSGHSTVLKRVLSYSSPSALMDDSIGGVEFFRFIADLEKNFDERKGELVEKLKLLSGRIFRKDGMLISLTGEEADFAALKEALPGFISRVPEGKAPDMPRDFSLTVKNEGFKTASLVQFVGMGGNFKKAGFEYTGALQVLKTIMGYEYLWQRLRVRGGAYGCFTIAYRNGEMAFLSYRDPNLSETLDTYRGVPEYLRSLDIDERDMTKYIIGTVSESDFPRQPHAKGMRSLAAYLSGITEERLQKERDQVLKCTLADIRALSPLVESVLQNEQICVLGNEEKILSCREIFGSVEKLSGDDNE